MLAQGITNKERGKGITLLLLMERHKSFLNEDILNLSRLNPKQSSSQTSRLGFTKEERCYLCEDRFDNIDDLSRLIIDKMSEYEYNSFLIGVSLPPKVEEKEDEMRSKFKLSWGESIKSEFSRELGKKVVDVTGKVVNHKRPDLQVIINPFTCHIHIKANSLYVGGRYKKLVGGIPQFNRFCWKCNGEGCIECNGTGKLFLQSIEEMMSEPIIKATEGTDVILHTSSWEKIESRVLGVGRPFILEVKNPIKRFVDLDKFEEDVNIHSKKRIEISDLSFVTKKFVKILKIKGDDEKLFKAIVEFEQNISDDELKKIEKNLNNIIIKQTYQSRKSRKKVLHSVNIKRLGLNLVEMLIKSQGGLNIEGFITGEKVRTSPNIREIVGIPIKCFSYDIIGIPKRLFSDE
jgi:tRNA pseudouridine synthase 10